MSPIIDLTDCFHKVSTSQELKETVTKINSGFKLKSPYEYHKLVKDFWFLDSGLEQWKNLFLESQK